ncbi:MAG: hypothetical protein KA955_08265 [Prevotella sp.]|nr:hypothetical protein [Prevotella sp.]
MELNLRQSPLASFLKILGCCYKISLLIAIQTFSIRSFAVSEKMDTTRDIKISEVVVLGHFHNGQSKGNIASKLKWNMKDMLSLPNILATTDPIKSLQLLPGITFNSEYDGGLYIQGCENSHNLISMGETPIYNAAHMLGIFSTFNTSHFKDVELITSNHTAIFDNRLGSEIKFNPIDTIAKRFVGEACVGLLASDFHLQVPMTENFSVYVSARKSCLNLFYSNFFSNDDMKLRYGLYDINSTVVVKPSDNDKIILNTYIGGDTMNYIDYINECVYKLDWGNITTSLDWHHYKGNNSLSQTLYYTHYSNNLTAKLLNITGLITSSISDVAYKGIWNINGFTVGTEQIYHTIQPQAPRLPENYSILGASAKSKLSYESNIFVGYLMKYNHLSADISMHNSNYIFEKHCWVNIDPRLTLQYSTNTFGTLEFHIGSYHQYLHKSGFTDKGYPTEYWFNASQIYKPESSTSISLSYSRNISYGYDFQIDLYEKELKNQPECQYDIIDMITGVAARNNGILMGDGRNYGASVMLRKTSGKLTGWLSYAYLSAKRKFNGYEYHSSHERPHEVSGVVTYHFRKLNLSLVALLASGNPSTPMQYAYVIGNKTIVEYGKFNSARLPYYFKVDIGATYWLKRAIINSSAIRLSIYNATAHSNTLHYSYINNSKNCHLHKDSFFFNILPTISYFVNF